MISTRIVALCHQPRRRSRSDAHQELGELVATGIIVDLVYPSPAAAAAPRRLAGFEEGDYREDPAMIVVGVREAEFGKDVSYVFLHRALGDPQLTADSGVRAPLRHECQHLAFARTQRVERVVPPANGYQLLDECGVHDRAAFGDPLERFNELRYVGDAALEQVTDSLAAGQQFHRVLDLGVGGKNQYSGLGELLTDPPCRLQALDGVGWRHADVDYYQ